VFAVGDTLLLGIRPALAADPDMIIFMDSADLPGGLAPTNWEIISNGVAGGQSFPDWFNNKYIRATGTSGSSGGNPTHTHTLLLATFNPEGTSGNNKDKGGSGTATANRTHMHLALANTSITPANNLPLYRSLVVLRYQGGGIPSTLPDNAIVMMETASISGNWELYIANDGRLLRGAATTTNAGNNNPTHTVAAGLGSASSVVDDSGSAITALPTTTHTHSAGSGVASDGPDIIPEYSELVFVRATAEITSFPDQMIAGFSGAIFDSADWAVVSGSGGAYENRFLMGDSSGSLTNGGSPNHSHAKVSVTTGGNVGTVGIDTSPSNGVTSGANHTHALEIELQASVDHTPEYATLVLAQYTKPIVNLAITAPANVNLGTGNPGTTVETTFAADALVTVTDAGNGWSLTAIVSDPLTGTPTPYMIPATNVKLKTDGTVGGGGDTSTIWSGTTSNVTEPASGSYPLDTPQSVGNRSSGTPADTTNVRPTIQVTIPVGAPTEEYTGTLTFTVV